ncbi:Inner-membrane translocator [Burkholderiales bacterium]|jgi:branched-chain amino acid transport system permease protein|nr:Inner-membrane translocator [Burkholderiales bacterium]
MDTTMSSAIVARLRQHWPVVLLATLLAAGLAAPLATGVATTGFFLEVLLGGLMAGVLYSLVALGFVLIYKASGVFNFAQGAMVLFAALATARLAEHMPLALAAALALLLMIGFAVIVERLVLRPLVNQSAVALLMATLGISTFLEGFGQAVWGNDIYRIDLGLPKEPMIVGAQRFAGGILISREDLAAAIVVGALVLVLGLFFQKTATGRALRAVADDHLAAQAIGIPLNRIWVIVWSVAGFVALIAGLVWGSKLGVQFSLSQVALKGLPVAILGGLTSVPGAILGGLIIGVGEKFAEVFLGQALARWFHLEGGGIEQWFAYVLVLAFLLVRPEGLFGERHIDRV